MQTPFVHLENVYKSYGSVKAVQALGFSADLSECVGLLGPNGAGKTTAMKMIYGRCRRDVNPHGLIRVAGVDPSTDELAIKYMSGVVPQENNLDEELNVEENLQVYARFYDLPKKTRKEHIAALLEFMELSDKRSVKIRELSGGMKRRLIIARSLLSNPRILFLDEPTTGLDPQVRHLIWDKLRALQKKGICILLTTHYMEEAFEICNRVIVMDKGRNVLEGNPRALLEKEIETHVLEIPDRAPFDSLNEDARRRIRIDDTGEIVRLYSDDGELLGRIGHSFRSSDYRLRPANLEDVFIKVTGRSLNAAQ